MFNACGECLVYEVFQTFITPLLLSLINTGQSYGTLYVESPFAQCSKKKHTVAGDDVHEFEKLIAGLLQSRGENQQG